jgi:hypothetical protein
VSEVGSSRCRLVFMDQSAEEVTPTQPTRDRPAPGFRDHWRHGRDVTKAAVRTALVVMLNVASQDANELVATDDQQLVQALPAHRADPALGDRVGVGRLHRCADDLGAVERQTSSNALVDLASRSRSRNLNAVAARRGRRPGAGLLGNPPPGRVRGDAGQVHPSACQFNEEQDIYPPQEIVSTVKKSPAMIPAACWRRNDRQLVGALRGAGSRPSARSTRRTPSCSSSPWIRWQPHRGFSLASRTTNRCTSSETGVGPWRWSGRSSAGPPCAGASAAASRAAPGTPTSVPVGADDSARRAVHGPWSAGGVVGVGGVAPQARGATPGSRPGWLPLIGSRAGPAQGCGAARGRRTTRAHGPPPMKASNDGAS